MSSFFVNGREVTVAQNQKLLPFLRDELLLTSVKNGCSEGACGTCMVLVDGKAVKACVQQTDKLAGKKIVTVEGLSPREKEVYAYAFAVSGAVQCGFCTPGMIMTAVDLVARKGHDLDDKTIREELEGNLCRCTGYHNIVKSIAAGAKAMAATTTAQAAE